MNTWKWITGTAAAIYVGKSVQIHDQNADARLAQELESEPRLESLARLLVSIAAAVGAFMLAQNPLLGIIFAILVWYLTMRHPKGIIILALLGLGAYFLLDFAIHAR